MLGLKNPVPSGLSRGRGWAMVDALLALVFWSGIGLSLMAQTWRLMAQQRSAWMSSQAVEWQSDALERLRLAHGDTTVQLGWGQVLSTPPCIDSACRATDWRDGLLADWQSRLSREAPQVQTWLAPWSIDPRLQVVALRWPEPGTPAQPLPLNQEMCPAGWRCVSMLGWP